MPTSHEYIKRRGADEKVHGARKIKRNRQTDRQTDTVADPEDHAKRVWGL